MDQVVKAATPEEIARVEARNEKQAQAAAKAPPRFVSDEKRELKVELTFPVEYDGATYTEVRIRRPIMREWRAYLRACEDAVKQHGPGADDLVDQPWMSVPAVVLEHLDFVDASKVEAAQEGFFARSPSDSEDEEPSASTSENGEP